MDVMFLLKPLFEIIGLLLNQAFQKAIAVSYRIYMFGPKYNFFHFFSSNCFSPNEINSSCFTRNCVQCFSLIIPMFNGRLCVSPSPVCCVLNVYVEPNDSRLGSVITWCWGFELHSHCVHINPVCSWIKPVPDKTKNPSYWSMNI